MFIKIYVVVSEPIKNSKGTPIKNKFYDSLNECDYLLNTNDISVIRPKLETIDGKKVHRILLSLASSLVEAIKPGTVCIDDETFKKLTEGECYGK